MRFLGFVGMLIALAWLPAPAAWSVQETQQATEDAPDATRSTLDGIHEDLVTLRFEKALAGIETLLGDTGLSEAHRAEALVLRAQTHVAFGDLNAAETDYREILSLRPAYVPEPSLTPSKAMKRFDRVQSAMIGRLAITLDPEDARLLLDGVEIQLPADGGLPLLAGEHTVQAQRKGFDPMTRTVMVEAGSLGGIELQLVPNARSVWIYTVQDDVEVHLDGVAVGRTRLRPGAEHAGRPAELLLEGLPPGEHVFELSKPCFRSERRQDNLTIDLLDRGPKRYVPVNLVPQRSTLVMVGGPPAAEVRLAGEFAGSLPMDPVEMCPGAYDVEVRYGGRTIWRSVEELVPARETVVDIMPRPNVALVGMEAGHTAMAALDSQFTTWRVDAPGGAPMSTIAHWAGVELAADTDLAIAPGSGRDVLYLYSPVLGVVTAIEDAAVISTRPRWSRAVWGFHTVDSRVGGRARVVQVLEGGAAQQAGLVVGDRVVTIGGRDVDGAGDVRELLAFASPRAPLEMEWLTAAGKKRKADLEGRPTTFLDFGPFEPAEAAVRAAWARVDAACDQDRSAALANLALLLAEFGDHSEAAQVWRLVRWSDRPGIGNGTAQYFLARELERLGQEADAVRAFRSAAESESTSIDDEGPRIGPAARDRLIDLGVSAVRDRRGRR